MRGPNPRCALLMLLFLYILCACLQMLFMYVRLCWLWTLHDGGLSSTVCRVCNCAWHELLNMAVRRAQFAQVAIVHGMTSSWWLSVVHSFQSLQSCNCAWHELLILAVCRPQFAGFTIMKLCMAWPLNHDSLLCTVCRVYIWAWHKLFITAVSRPQFADVTIEHGMNS